MLTTNIQDNTFIMSPKVDFCFKELMMKETIRKGFISTVLQIPVDEIKSAKVLNTYLRKTRKEEKQGILDVRLEINDSYQIDIEIQIKELKIWGDRSLFYTSKMFIEQIEESDDYNIFRKCINISILDFNLFPNINKFYSKFHIREDETNVLYTDKMEWHIIELPKVPKKKSENQNQLELWARFFKSEGRDDFEMLSKENEMMKEAYDYLKIISQDKEKRREYEERQKAIRDYNAFMRQGKEEGREEGKKEGIKEGRKEGRKEGEREKAIEIAKNLLDILDIQTISQKTGLSIEEVKEISKTI